MDADIIAILDKERGRTTREAAEFLGVAVTTLQKFRTFGGGPVYFRVGSAVRYRLRDLLAFQEGQLCQSTSAYPVPSRSGRPKAA